MKFKSIARLSFGFLVWSVLIFPLGIIYLVPVLMIGFGAGCDFVWKVWKYWTGRLSEDLGGEMREAIDKMRLFLAVRFLHLCVDVLPMRGIETIIIAGHIAAMTRELQELG